MHSTASIARFLTPTIPHSRRAARRSTTGPCATRRPFGSHLDQILHTSNPITRAHAHISSRHLYHGMDLLTQARSVSIKNTGDSFAFIFERRFMKRPGRAGRAASRCTSAIPQLQVNHPQRTPGTSKTAPHLYEQTERRQPNSPRKIPAPASTPRRWPGSETTLCIRTIERTGVVGRGHCYFLRHQEPFHDHLQGHYAAVDDKISEPPLPSAARLAFAKYAVMAEIPA